MPMSERPDAAGDAAPDASEGVNPDPSTVDGQPDGSTEPAESEATASEAAASPSALVAAVARALQAEVGKVIVGQEEVVTQSLIALLAGGHVLLEGVPGLAKTLLVRTLALALQCDFRRVQFTPDLMPSDVVGTTLFDLQSGSFHLKKGPVFTNLLLADEVNRTPPKTQSALLEAMEERQVSLDGVTHPLPSPFMVFATQNPIEQEGTYALPEAQLDRFLMKVLVDYPSLEEEEAVLRQHHLGFDTHRLGASGVSARADSALVEQCRQAARRVRVEEEMLRYIATIIRRTRESGTILLGASPRAGVALLETSKVAAAIKGRGFVIPDDVKELALPVLRHRIVLRPEAEIEGTSPDAVLKALLARIEVPR